MAKPLETFHASVVRDLYKGPVSDQEALAIMAVLHHHQIAVRPGVLSDTKERQLAAITQRHAADCVAGLWSGTDDEKGDYAHWYWEWNTKVGAEMADSLPAWLRPLYDDTKAKIATHPDIEGLELED